ncbi:MAG: SDR family oxidoreductase [Pleurocapsa sp.]
MFKLNSGVFNNQVAIVTGASSGIGRELAYQLAQQGAQLVLAARDRDRLEEVVLNCQAKGGKAIAVPTDVTKQEDCQQLIATTLTTYGRIEMLINAAARSIGGYFDEFLDLSLFKTVMDVNYFGSLYCTHYALPYLAKTKGRIVGVCCLGGKVAGPHHTGYCASKFAMNGFFESLRVELLEKQVEVSVTLAYPDFVVTELLERTIEPNGKPLGEVGKRFYTKKMMSPQACALLILKAAAKKQRQMVMPWQGKLGLWLNFWFPHLTDRLIAKVALAHKQRLDSLRAEVGEV